MSNVKDSDMLDAHNWADAREELASMGSLFDPNVLPHRYRGVFTASATSLQNIPRKDPAEVFKELQQLIVEMKAKYPQVERVSPFGHLVIDSHMPLEQMLVSSRSMAKGSMLNNAMRGMPTMITIDDVEQVPDVDQPFWDGIKAIKCHKRNEDRKHGHPKRKPQPNRGPVGRKDWK